MSTCESELRTNILPDALLEESETFKIVAQREFQRLVETATRVERTRTPRPAKNIVQVMELIQQAFLDYEARTNASEEAKIRVTYEKPDTDQDLETISICLAQRDPGMFAQGSPMSGGTKVKNRRPLLRDILDDPDNPGYKRAVFGFFYDNIVRLTCWARTAKVANERALWVEDVMEEYTWFFVFSGANRVLYDGRRAEVVHDIKGNRFYGRPVDYFVRTEKLRNVSQKVLEQICVQMSQRINYIDAT